MYLFVLFYNVSSIVSERCLLLGNSIEIRLFQEFSALLSFLLNHLLLCCIDYKAVRRVFLSNLPAFMGRIDSKWSNCRHSGDPAIVIIGLLFGHSLSRYSFPLFDIFFNNMSFYLTSCSLLDWEGRQALLEDWSDKSRYHQQERE